jgi:hypothetical protein
VTQQQQVAREGRQQWQLKMLLPQEMQQMLCWRSGAGVFSHSTAALLLWVLQLPDACAVC